MADFNGSYIPGHDSVALYADELATIVSSGTPQALVDTFTLLSLAKPPSVRRVEGNRIGYAAGTRIGQHKLKGSRLYEIGLSAHLSDFDFLDKCLTPSGIAFKYGASGGTQHVVRGVACNTVEISAQRGDGEIAMSAQLLGLIHQYGQTAYTWDSGDATAVPYTWHNITEINIGTTNYRAFAMSLQLSVNHNLEPKNTRPDVGDDNVISRTPYALMPHLKNVSGTIVFDTFLPAALFNTADDTTVAADDISFVIAGSDGTVIRTITITDPVITAHGQDASEIEGELINSISFEALNVTSEAPAP